MTSARSQKSLGRRLGRSGVATTMGGGVAPMTRLDAVTGVVLRRCKHTLLTGVAGIHSCNRDNRSRSLRMVMLITIPIM